MSYKQILVQTGPGLSDAPRIELAARLARRFQASLTGVFVSPPPVWRTFVPSIESAPSTQMTLAELEAERDATVGRELELSGEALRAAARPHGIEPTFETISDNLVVFAAMARTADLTVMPAPGDRGAALIAAPDQLALACGGPVLMAPEAWSPGSAGDRILVAWNGAAEAARAVKDALPLLKQAEHIDVLIVDRDPASADAEITVPQFLARHGCASAAVRVSSVDQSVGEVLLREAHHLDADMIVMGLYGHSRLREVVLGGASRHLLQRARLPLFVSH
jgi:nucleotide-binding universal stress UspA family protein